MTRRIETAFDTYADEIRGMGTEARGAEMANVLKSMMEKHVTLSASAFPRISLVTLDLDHIFLPIWGKTLDIEEGMNLLMDSGYRADGEYNADQAGILYTVGLAEDEEQRILDAIDRGETEYIDTEPRELHLVLNPIVIEPADHHVGATVPLRLADVLASIAMVEALEAGDVDRADRLVTLFYLPTDKGQEADSPRDKLPSISTSSIGEVTFTTDKLNKKAWDQWATLPPGQLAVGFDEDGSGQVGINLANDRDRAAGIQRVMTYSIDFASLEEEGIAPRLEPYDKRVYEALSSLWNSKAEQDVFSIKDVCVAMGYQGEPPSATKRKIRDSIIKMGGAHISVDNLEEVSAYRYPHFRYDGQLLPYEMTTGYVDGNLTNGLIHLFREPPLFTFARERRQVSSYKVQLLQVPISKTNKNILIEDYVRDQIAWMKNKKGKRSNRLTLEAIFDAAGISSRDQKKRKRTDITKLLDHYVDCAWIARYAEDEDGFTIYF